MRTYESGNTVRYRDAGTDELYDGRVLTQLRRHGEVYGYEVEVEHGTVATVLNHQVVDWRQVSADASAALARIHRAERGRACLLDELLGALSYYVECGADLVFDHQVGDSAVRDRVTRPLSEIVDRYVERRDRLAG